MLALPLAIVAALDDEVRIILSKMDVDSRVHRRPALFTLGRYMGHQIAIVRTGVGLHAMEQGMNEFLAQYRPALCLHVGYCGGADPHYQPGDLLIATAIADARSGESCECDGELVERADRICREGGLRARKGRLVTVERVVSSSHDKAFVGTEHEAQGIDMESFEFDRACRARGVKNLVVRAVLDPLDMALPDMHDVVVEDGSTDSMALAGHLIRRPKDILGLPRLQYFATEARGAITAFVNEWIVKSSKEVTQ